MGNGFGGQSVSVDDLGNVFIAGDTFGDFGGPNAGASDAFVSKYDASGGLLWTEQIGTNGLDISNDVSADGLGNVYVTGLSAGNTEEDNGMFVRKYDTDGNLLWVEQFGTVGVDAGNGISADGLGNVYISGGTNGNLGATNAGFRDAFLAKFSDPIPEPSSLLLSMIAIVGLALRRNGK